MTITEANGKETARNLYHLAVFVIILLLIFLVVARIWIAVAILSILFLFNLTLKLRARALSIKDGSYILDYGSGMTWFALVSAFIFMLIGLIASLFGVNKPGEVSIETAITYMLVFMTTWPIFLEGTFSYYVINTQGIGKHSIWSRRLFIHWGEIESIRFNCLNQWFLVKGGKGAIRLHVYLDNLYIFANNVISFVPEERWLPVKELIESLASDQAKTSQQIIENGKVNNLYYSTTTRKARKVKIESHGRKKND